MSLSLILSNLVIKWLEAFFLMFLMFRVYWVSWICEFIIYQIWKNVGLYIFKSFCAPHLFSDANYIYIILLQAVSSGSLMLFSFLSHYLFCVSSFRYFHSYAFMFTSFFLLHWSYTLLIPFIVFFHLTHSNFHLWKGNLCLFFIYSMPLLNSLNI